MNKCDSCKYYKIYNEDESLGNDPYPFYCEKLTRNKYTGIFIVNFPDDGGIVLVEKDFGCALWELHNES